MRCYAAAELWRAGLSRAKQDTHLLFEVSWMLEYCCMTNKPDSRDAVAARVVKRSLDERLCSTRCRIDNYGAIDPEEMAIVQMAMV